MFEYIRTILCYFTFVEDKNEHFFFVYSYIIKIKLQSISDTYHRLIVEHIVEECLQYTSIRTDLNVPSNIVKVFGES
jgi:hypothetical protein